MSAGGLGELIACKKCGQLRAPSDFQKRENRKWRVRTCKACMPQFKAGPRGETDTRQRRRTWQAQNEEKRAAHKAIEKALVRGDITRKPCERCGATVRIYAHHDDYSNPLDVRWLCGKHHYERHKEIGRPMGRQKAAA